MPNGLAGVVFYGVRAFSAGVFSLFLSLPHPSVAQYTSRDFLTQCFSGYRAQRLQEDYESFYSEPYSYSSDRLYLKPQLVNWLDQHHWPRAYASWQLAAHCVTEPTNSDTRAVCSEAGREYFPAQACSSKQASLSYLTMHRYLLQSMRSSWPELDDFFKGWAKFPLQEDFPEPIQDQVYAWPDEVMRSARLADSIPKLPHQELLQRWPTEADFAHWLLCASDQAGLGIDAVYGALMSNGFAMDAPAAGGANENLQHYLFWQAQGWVERVWNKYRMQIGKMPHDSELQADVLRQCESFQYWVAQTAGETVLPVNRQKSVSPVFTNGHLSVARSGQSQRVLGEVLTLATQSFVEESRAGDVRSVDQRRADNGQLHWLEMDLKRLGVEPVWVYSRMPLVDPSLKVGRSLVVIGHIQQTQHFDPAQLPAGVDAQTNPTVLVAQSIQTPK